MGYTAEAHTPVGMCGVCKKIRRLTMFGMMWHHTVPKTRVRCSGTGQPPILQPDWEEEGDADADGA